MAKKSVKIPTYTGGSVVPQQKFTLPVQSGAALQNIVSDVTNIANNVADATAVNEAEILGKKKQVEALEKGENTYLGAYNPASLTGQAFQKGAKTAYVASKSAEFETKLQEIRSKNSTNPGAYTIEANEYKSEFLGTINSDLQPDFSLKFDQVNSNNLIQVTGADILQQKDQQILDISTGIDTELGKLVGSIETQGLDGNTQIDISIPALTNYLTDLGPNALDLNASEIDAKMTKVRNAIELTYLKYAWTNAETVEERDKILADLRTNKSEVLSELQETFGDTLPIKSTLGYRDLTLYNSEMAKYVKDSNKAYASEIKVETDRHTNFMNDQMDGKRLDEKFDYGPLKIKNLTEDKITSMKIQEGNAFRIGVVVKIAKNSSITGITEIESQINEDIALIRNGDTKIDPDYPSELVADYSNLTQQEKDILIEEKNEILKRIQTVQEEKQTAIENGNQIGYIEKNIDEKFEFDYTSEQAIETTVLPVVQKYFPYSYKKIKFPPDLVKAELDQIKTATSREQAIGLIINFKNKYGKFYGNFVQTAVTPDGKTITEGGGDLAYLVMGHLVEDTGIEAQSDIGTLWAATADRIDNEANTTQRNSSTINENIDDFDLNFETQFNDVLPGNVRYYAAVKETAKNIYFQARGGANPVDHDIAMERAFNFLNKNFQTVEFSNGTQMMLPNYEDGKAFVEAANDILANPGDYNIILGGGETLTDFIKDNKNYTFGYEDGALILVNNESKFGIQPKALLPSGANDLIYSELIYTPANKDVVQSEDIELTWQLDTPNNWYSNFEKNTKFTTERTVEAIPGMSEEFTYNIDDTTEQKARKLAMYFTETMVNRDDNGAEQGTAYIDKFALALTGSDDNMMKELNAISLAIKEGSYEDWMFEHMSTIPYLAKLKNPKNVEYVKAELAKIDPNNPPTTKNNEATVKTVLQTLASITRNAPHSPSDIEETYSGYSYGGYYNDGTETQVDESQWWEQKYGTIIYRR